MTLDQVVTIENRPRWADSDTMSGFGDDDRSSVTSIYSESDVAIHNVTSVRSLLLLPSRST